MKNVFIETYGCQMNEYDSELIRSILTKENYAFVKNEFDADIVMLNTCAIRENAHRKIYGRVHALKHARRDNPPKIGILGCMATNLRTDLLEDRNLNIDFIAGPDSYKRLPELIEQCYALDVETPHRGVSTDKPFDVTLSEFETYSDVIPARTDGVNSWLAIMRGCNNFCTFCVVPYTRGRERSRSTENIVEEVKLLAAQGFKQVTLLGQNVNSYRHEQNDFAKLLEAVASVDGIERIRFTSPHPKDFPDSLLQVMARNKKVCKHIHLPLQAGNDRVLDMMNRTYTQKEFLDLVVKIRTLMPTISLTTDIIVGFPTETDAEFEDTYRVMKEVEFDSAFMFKYSERKNTIASRKFPDDVSDEVKTERIVCLNELQKEISHKKNQEHIGQVHELLIEQEQSIHNPNFSVGRTDGNKIVTFPANHHKRNEFILTRITVATPHGLKGEVLKDSSS